MNDQKHLTSEVSKEDISNVVADEHGVLYSRDGQRLLRCENKNLTDYTVRNGTEVICDYAFSGCTGLTSITIPKSVTEIGSYAFMGCSALTGTLTIPDGVTTIGDSAFRDCKGPTSVTIPNSVTMIGSCAFVGCSGLSGELSIPNSVTTIGSYAFYQCTGLTKVTIGNSVTSIGSYAFEGCTHLTGTLTIPNSVTAIGSYAFWYCSGLTGTLTIPKSVTAIGSYAFRECTGLTKFEVAEGNKYYCSVDGVLFTKDMTTLIQFPAASSMTSYDIPNSVTSIGKCAFSGCIGLTQVTIPNSVTSIGKCAFANCIGLKQVTIPESVTEMGSSAFEYCRDLKRVNFNATACTWAGSSNPQRVICGFDNLGMSVEPFHSHMAFYGCDNIVTVIFGDNVTIIPDYLCNELTGLTSITIPNSVTSVGRGAFEDCDGLTEVIIGNSVTKIGNGAFAYCSGLTDALTIPDSVTKIGDDAFRGCTELTEVTIPDSVAAIGVGVFAGCKGLTKVTIGDSVTTIDNDAFSNCSSLPSINIPSSVVKMSWTAFNGCTGLRSVFFEDGEETLTIPWQHVGYIVPSFASLESLYIGRKLSYSEITTISGNLYRYYSPFSSTTLKSVTIGEKVRSLPIYLFSGCTELKEITIPDMVTEIGNCVFSGCSELNVIRIVCSQNDESYVLEKFKKLLPEELHDIISIEHVEQLPSNKTGKTTYAEPTESETLVVSETDNAYANDIADKLSADRVDYDIPPETQDEIDWEYPVVKYPQYGCVVFPYRNRSIARMGYMEPLFLDYLLKTFDGCGLQIVGDCSILPRDGQRPYEPDIAIIPDEYPSIRIDVEIDEPYAAVTNKPIHYIGCGDDFRDMNLNNLGWIVIRLTEYQVYTNMKGCVAFIAQVLHNIQPRMSLPAYLLSYPVPEMAERWQEIEAKVWATEKYREKYLKHKFTESEKREYTTADVTQTELEKECAELVSPLIVSPTSKTADEAIDRGDISTRQKHTDKCQEAQHDAAPIGTNHTDVVSTPSIVLPVAIEKRDELIQFFPFEHIYLYNGCAKLTPVSSVIDCFFEQFDALTQAQAKAYKDMPAGKILEDWDIKGCMAKEAGTFMHKQIENLYNGLEYKKIYHFRYDGKYLHADMEIPLEREYHHFQNFLKDHDFKPHKTEWAIYDENLEIAGTIDMLHKRGDVFDIYDWKRSNKIVDDQGTPVKIGFRGKSGINGLESVQDTAYWHYCIQQNLYRYILEKNYGITVGRMYLVVMIATMDNYIKLEVPRMGKAIDVIVEKCRNGFIKWMNIGLPV